jgi:hypothetical protein
MARKDAKKKKRRVTSGPMEHSDSNGATYLTCVEHVWPAAERARRLSGCLATSDPHDRAHLKRDGAGFLMPAAKDGIPFRMAARPRAYPEDQCVRRIMSVASEAVVNGVLAWERRVICVDHIGIDSMFDQWWEKYLGLIAAGIPMAGLRQNDQGEDAFRRQLYLPPDQRLRDVLHQRTVQSGMTERELALEQEASRMLGEEP